MVNDNQKNLRDIPVTKDPVIQYTVGELIQAVEKRCKHHPFTESWIAILKDLISNVGRKDYASFFDLEMISVSNYSLKIKSSSEEFRNYIQTFYHRDLESAVKRVYPNVEEIHYLVSSPVERERLVNSWKAEVA